jgi:hypothetical protein
MELAPFSTIQRLAAAIYSNNISLCGDDTLAKEAIEKHQFATAYGFTPAQVEAMDAVDAELLKTILKVQLHMAAAKSRRGQQKGISLLPEGMIFQKAPPT